MPHNSIKPVLFSVIVTLSGLFATGVSAQEAATQAPLFHDIRIGVLAHDVTGLVSGFRRESGTDLNFEVTLPMKAEWLGGVLRPALGGTLNLSGDTSKFYAYGRWQRDFASGLFLALGLGVALHNGETDLVAIDRKALGSAWLFHIPVELGFNLDDRHSLSIYFDHLSNANLSFNNEGMDTIGIRYGFRL